MKKLICYTDIEEVHKQGKNYLIINDETIVTPLAKDLMDEYKMEIRYELNSSEKNIIEDDQLGLNLTKESFIELLRKVLTEGNQSSSYFETEIHENGLKVVKGDTVKLSKFDIGKCDEKIYSQELVGNDETTANAGIVEMNETTVDWTLKSDEINYVISGEVSVKIDGKEYHAKTGDTIYIPNKSTITWCVPKQVKLFYVTYPTN